MKLYEDKYAPNPRRVRVFLAEKDIALPERVQVNILKRENLADEHFARNPFGKLPVLELDDGTRISESIAICRYFEEQKPEPALFGTGALERATIEMWQRQAEIEGLMTVALVFRNSWEGFRGRHLSGVAEPTAQIPELAAQARMLVDRNFTLFDERLAGSEFLAGDRYTVADITLLCTVDFAKRTGLELCADRPHLSRWYAAVAARPSAKA